MRIKNEKREEKRRSKDPSIKAELMEMFTMNATGITTTRRNAKQRREDRLIAEQKLSRGNHLSLSRLKQLRTR